VFSFEEGKDKGELCLRPETAPLKISSFVKKKEEEEKNFAKLSFFLSFFRQRKERFYLTLTTSTVIKPPELCHR
jgi:hypothetical protein